jgi:AcrR family transcriptional regulator
LFHTGVLYKRSKQAFKESGMLGLDTENAHNLTKEAKETMTRLLDAAEELFAQKGFDGTSIRDITTKARRNQAAVNYFFGDKKVLYEELFRRRLREMREIRLAGIKKAMLKGKNQTLENLIHSFSVAFLEPFSDPKRSERFMRLFARELIDQRLPKKMFFDEMALPVTAAFEEAMAAICSQLSRRDAQMAIHSIIGQLLHLMQVRFMLEGSQGSSIASFDANEAIDYIVKFSAAGIRAFVQGTQ